MISDSFYKKAAEILRKTRTDKNAACWKTLACADDVRDKKLMYALLSEVCKCKRLLCAKIAFFLIFGFNFETDRDALEHVATAAGLFKAEPRISPELLLIGTYEVLFRADARCSETLVAPIKRHKTRLHAELVKLKIKRGVTSNTQLATQSAADRFPRFVRVNTLKSTLQEICAVFERLQLKRGTLQRAADGSLAFADSLSYAIDDHVDNLLALPRSVSLANTPAYKQGKIIIQVSF